MKKKSLYYILFFILLFFAFYFIMGKVIPGFTKKKDTTISEVLPFSFINMDGKPFTNKDVAGKVYVAEYFYTTCHGICPKMNNNMRKVYNRFKNEDGFLILSYTCDPETDSAARLKHYADSLGVSTSKWIFLTGRKDSLYYHARLSYQIDDPKNNLKNIDDDFMHTQFWALVDKNGKVKHIYDGLKPSEVNQMIDDIETLLNKRS